MRLNRNDAHSSIIASILISKAAVATFNISPFLLGGYIDHLGLSAAQASRALSVEIFALAASNAAGCLWLRHVDHKSLAQRLLIGLIALNVSCIFTTGYGTLLAQRTAVGVAEGALLAVGFGSLGMTSQPERNFGYYFAVSLTVGAINVRILPLFLDAAGVAGLFTNLCLYAVLALVGSYWLGSGPGVESLTERGKSAGDGEPTPLHPTAISSGALAALLAANYVYFVGQGGVWSFFKRIGQQHGLSLTDIAFALSLSLLMGVLGGLASSWLNLRFGRMLPLLAAILIASVSIGLLWDSPGAAAFAIAACLFNFANNFGHPYILGVAARMDPAGRLTVLSGSLHTAGQATGPFLVGTLVSSTDFTNALWVGIVMFALTALLLAPIARTTRTKAAALPADRTAP